MASTEIDSLEQCIDMENIKLSIIIPAYNEEQYIKAALDSIFDSPLAACYEVIVVDNGSTDATAKIIAQSPAKYVNFPAGASIAAVRNKGVSHSHGDILVFLDADTLVSQTWHQNILQAIQNLEQNPDTITGSRCLVKDPMSWLNRHWFDLLNHYQAEYINSGHLVTSRCLFEQLGGFNERLQTAEDYDFCMRAVKSGAVIEENKQLPVIHDGYPQTIKALIQRERWHGKEDFNSLQSLYESKLAWISISYLLFFIFALSQSFYSGNILILLIALIFLYVSSLFLSLYKFGNVGLFNLLNTAMIFNFYLLGRCMALIDRLMTLLLKKKYGE